LKNSLGSHRSSKTFGLEQREQEVTEQAERERGGQKNVEHEGSSVFAKANVKRGDGEKRDAQQNENQIEHGLRSPGEAGKRGGRASLLDEWRKGHRELRGARRRGGAS